MHNKEFIQLDDSLLYGQGSHKKCFLHPHNKNLCIKIAYNEGGQKDLIREINYIDVLKRRHKDYSILPKYFGKVNTNLGTGYVFEIIRDYNNGRTQTLEDFITDLNLFSQNYSLIVSLLKELKEKLYKNEIITMVLFPENILFQKTDENNYRVRIVNDMGSAVLIPLEYHFKYFAHTKILRRWKMFLEVLRNKYASHLSEKLIEEIK
jgi:Trp operon repressor